MTPVCNIYYNRLTHKWAFYEVSKNGEELLLSNIMDLKGLEEGDGTKISWEHLVEIKKYLVTTYNFTLIDKYKMVLKISTIFFGFELNLKYFVENLESAFQPRGSEVYH